MKNSFVYDDKITTHIFLLILNNINILKETFNKNL
jgi:hypothetical protein